MRFVPVKSEESQAVLVVHRVREGVVAERTGVANQMRGLMTEVGIVIPKGCESYGAPVGASAGSRAAWASSAPIFTANYGRSASIRNRIPASLRIKHRRRRV